MLFRSARVAEGQLGRGEAVDSDVGGNVTTQSGSNLADGTTTSSSNTQPVSVRLPIRVYVRDSHAFSNWRDVRYVSAPMRSIFSGDETFEGKYFPPTTFHLLIAHTRTRRDVFPLP